MWKSEGERILRVGPVMLRWPRKPSCLLIAVVCLLSSTGCRKDMQDQPRMKPYRSSTFFRDGLSSRQPVEGTIARGLLKTDKELFTGKKAQTTAAPQATPGGPTPRSSSGAVTSIAAAYPDDVDTFPFPITPEVMARGRQRYEIFCSVCHGSTGYGDGIVVRRGFRRAASYHDDRLRQAPVGHFFDVISNGWGVMPSYASQVPVQDRWAIIAYIRALQLSQQNQQTKIPATPALSAQSSTPASGGHQR
ncbi:MAG TPA: cytochrome c [Pyrinomonadaceae bacterium]|nr:cytochrome c [Pyrinomonadaceae bacterium]